MVVMGRTQADDRRIATITTLTHDDLRIAYTTGDIEIIHATSRIITVG
jgi:hypothetical protein